MKKSKRGGKSAPEKEKRDKSCRENKKLANNPNEQEEAVQEKRI